MQSREILLLIGQRLLDLLEEIHPHGIARIGRVTLDYPLANLLDEHVVRAPALEHVVDLAGVAVLRDLVAVDVHVAALVGAGDDHVMRRTCLWNSAKWGTPSPTPTRNACLISPNVPRE